MKLSFDNVCGLEFLESAGLKTCPFYSEMINKKTCGTLENLGRTSEENQGYFRDSNRASEMTRAVIYNRDSVINV